MKRSMTFLVARILTGLIAALLIQPTIASAQAGERSTAQSNGRMTRQLFTPPAVFALTITDMDGAPIEGATVLIGESTGTFADEGIESTQTTDRGGQVAIPQNWFMPAPVTINAPGFVRATYLDLAPSVRNLKIRRQTFEQSPSQDQATVAPPARFELDGDTSGFGNLKNDGIFDIGLVVQAITRAQLSTLNLQSLISPEVDHFTVLGQSVDLPSNITIPSQTENYIFPLHFDKSTFRLFLPTSGTWQIAALHARVPFKSTIDALQNGRSIIDIVNTFEFREGSVTPINIMAATQSQDLTVNAAAFTKSISFTAPAFDRSMSLLTISLANSNGAYYPTDIKNVASSSTVQLTAPAGASVTGMVLAAYKKASSQSTGPAADQYSAVTLPNNETRPFDPIRLVEPPLVNRNQLMLDTPTAAVGINPVMTYATLSIVTAMTKGKLQIENKQVLWDVWAPNWMNKLDLPSTPLPSIDRTTQSLRWEVGFSAQFTGQKSVPPGPDALEKITHVTRSAVDL